MLQLITLKSVIGVEVNINTNLLTTFFPFKMRNISLLLYTIIILPLLIPENCWSIPPNPRFIAKYESSEFPPWQGNIKISAWNTFPVLQKRTLMLHSHSAPLYHFFLQSIPVGNHSPPSNTEAIKSNKTAYSDRL